MEIQTVQDWLNKFEKLICEKNTEKILDLFSDSTSWRDLISFTWNIITFETKSEIKSMLDSVLLEINPENFQIIDMKVKTNSNEAWFTFDTKHAKCKGHIRLENGKAITFLSVMSELKGYEEKSGYNRELGTEFGAFKYTNLSILLKSFLY